MSGDALPVTPGTVEERLANLRGLVADPEMFHIIEDELLVDVLRAIGDGSCVHPVECARLAVSSHDWPDITRWCA